MSKSDCSSGGRTPDGFTMQDDGFTMQNNERTTQNHGLTMPNVSDNVSRIPSVKETLCYMWNVFTAHARWRSDATIASNSKASTKPQTTVEETGKNAKAIDDEYETEDMIVRRNLVSNQTLSALIGLASYAWVCIFLGWMVSGILAAVFRTERPEIGVLLNGDQDRYDSYVNQFSMKLQSLIATIIPPLYLVSWVLVAIWFTNVILYSVEFANVISDYSSTIASSTPFAIPASIIPIAWASRAIAWTTNTALTWTSKVRPMVSRRWSSKVMARIQSCVFWILLGLAMWSYIVVRMMNPGFVPENEWPYKGDPFRYDYFIPHNAFNNSDAIGSSHTAGTPHAFGQAHVLGNSTLGSFHLVGNSDHSDRMINMKGRYLWYWDDPEMRLKVAKQWERLASSQSRKSTAEDDTSIKKSEWKKIPNSSAISLKNGFSKTFVDDISTTNTRTTQASNPSDIGLDHMDVRYYTKRAITSVEDIDSADIDNAAGKSGEFTDQHLSLYDQKILYNMVVVHYFDTVFSDHERMLASGMPYYVVNSESANSDSTGYSAGHNSTGYINPAGYSVTGYIINSAWHSSTGYIDDSDGYIQRPGDDDTTRDVQHSIRNERIHAIQYDPFRRIFVPYGAQYSGLHDKYVVDLQAYPPLMTRWLRGFVGKPIGFRNQKPLFLFLLYSWMLSFYVLMVSGMKMLIWHPKSAALNGTKEPRPLNEEVNRGLLQKSPRKERVCIVTTEDLTRKFTENDRKISVSDKDSNITDKNCMATVVDNVDGNTKLEKNSMGACDSATDIEQRENANENKKRYDTDQTKNSGEVSLGTASTTVPRSIASKTKYTLVIPLVWCLFHGICSVYMISCFVPEMQDRFLSALDTQDAIGNTNSGGIDRSLSSTLCSLLPHEACLGMNTMEDFARSNQGADASSAGMKVLKPSAREYPSTQPVSIHLASVRPASIAQSFLQPEPNKGSLAFYGETPQGHKCQIRSNEPALQEAFQNLHAHATGISDEECCSFSWLCWSEYSAHANRLLQTGGWKFEYLGGENGGAVYHIAGTPTGIIHGGGNRCDEFIVKIQGAVRPLNQKQISSLHLDDLRAEFPHVVWLPLLPTPDYADRFGPRGRMYSTVTFAIYGAGGSVAKTLRQHKPAFFMVFIKNLVRLMEVVSKLGSNDAIHGNIKTSNLVFTTSEIDANCGVAIIDWDIAMNKKRHVELFWKGDYKGRDSGTNSYMVVTPIEGAYILLSNDEYALVLCGAIAMIGLPKFGSLRLVFDRDKLHHGKRESNSVVDIPKLIDMLVSSKYSGQFPLVHWGETWDEGDADKKYIRVWIIFIRSYLVLWDINSMLLDVTAYDSGKPWTPALHCFSDNHATVTFSNLKENPEPPIDNVHKYAEDAGPEVKLNLQQYCKQHWKIAHESLECLWETPKDPNASCIVKFEKYKLELERDHHDHDRQGQEKN